MKHLLHDHPVTSRLVGIGFPGWLGFAIAGWPIALLGALCAILAFLIIWAR